MFEGLFERAIPGATTSLRLAIELFGLKSVDLVPSYLILGEASQGLGSLTQAQEYLSQAEWTVAKNTECPNNILHKLYRNMAMLQMSQGHLEQALRNLANDVNSLYYSDYIDYAGKLLSEFCHSKNIRKTWMNFDKIHRLNNILFIMLLSCRSKRI